jgi:hypothetical protein
MCSSTGSCPWRKELARTHGRGSAGVSQPLDFEETIIFVPATSYGIVFLKQNLFYPGLVKKKGFVTNATLSCERVSPFTLVILHSFKMNLPLQRCPVGM